MYINFKVYFDLLPLKKVFTAVEKVMVLFGNTITCSTDVSRGREMRILKTFKI